MMNFLLCVSVDKRKVGKDEKYIKNVLKSFYCRLNGVSKLGKDDLFLTTCTEDKVFALVEYKNGFLVSAVYNPFLYRDRDANNFYEFALSTDSVTDEDSTIYLCKRLDELFDELLCSEKYLDDAIKVVGSDAIGHEVDFKYSRTYSMKCTEDDVKIYEKTVSGLRYELLSERDDEKLYGFAFDNFVIPYYSSGRFGVWFSFVRKTLYDENTTKLRSILMKALVEIFNNESIDLSY